MAWHRYSLIYSDAMLIFSNPTECRIDRLTTTKRRPTMASPGTSAAATATAVRTVYRELLRLSKGTPAQVEELRTSFRRPLDPGETAQLRLKDAESRLSFLRMTTPKTKRQTEKTGGGTWVYREGQRLKAEKGTLRDSSGRVVANWDGKNLDPESIKRHRQQLKRMGFVNNSHAKGFF